VASFDLSRRVVGVIAGRRSKWIVLVIWLALLAGFGSFSGKLSSVTKDTASSYLPGSAESTRVLDILTKQGSSQGGSTVDVLYVRSRGLTDADRARAQAYQQRLTQLVPGQAPAALIPSKDGRALLVSANLPPETSNSTATQNLVNKLESMAAADRHGGLDVYVTGQAATTVDYVAGFSGVDTKVLVAALIVVTILLLLIYRSPFLWLLSLAVAGAGYAAAAVAVYFMGSGGGLVIDSQSTGVLAVLVLGAGTDYALLLIARYREELRRHEDQHVAMQEALLRAGPAILASAATVTIALLCLLVAQLNSERGLGPVGAVGIVAAFAAMTTLLPALLVAIGRGIFWPFTPSDASMDAEGHSARGRIADWIGRRPRMTWASAAACLLLLVLGLTQLTQGLRASDALRPASQSVLGQRELAAHYPAGYTSPTLVIVNPSAVATVSTAAASVKGVSTVLPSGDLGGQVVVPVILSDPPDSQAAQATVGRLRDAVRAVPNAGALVGGDTAVALDTKTGSIRDEQVVMPLVLIVILIVLALLLRALVAPLVLIATVVLTYLGALGASALLFAWVFHFPATDFTVSLLGFVFLIALGVDYNIFLMTRVREEVSSHGHAPGVRRGLSATGGVITSAGIVLAATFAVLTVLPLVGLAELGILVAVGVLLDTFVVRTVLVPAAVLELGWKTWWPGRLSQGDEPAPARSATTVQQPAEPDQVAGDVNPHEGDRVGAARPQGEP
jgi:putative drug exporter of the RND superfamily